MVQTQIFQKKIDCSFFEYRGKPKGSDEPSLQVEPRVLFFLLAELTMVIGCRDYRRGAARILVSTELTRVNGVPGAGVAFYQMG